MFIKAVLTSYHSKRDNAGNCYWAFSYTDTLTGRSLVAKVACESNLISAMHVLGMYGQDYIYHAGEFPIRQFDRMVKGWEYAGCAPEDIATFIKEKLSSEYVSGV